VSERTVLYVLHNHPTIMPGGAETYGLELYHAMQRIPGWRPVLLARTGPPIASFGRPHEGTLLSPVGRDPDQYFLHTEVEDYDWFLSTSRNKDTYTRFYREFLETVRPDVVHFQHTLFLGYDILRETRASLPNAAIVYTLHEYVPICHNNGQMVRHNGERCLEASPRRCHECFPDISPQSFFMRERFIKSHLDVVDRFVSPSRFLVDRYADWGIERDRIVHEPNGRPPLAPVDAQVDAPITVSAPRRRRDRIGYFGQFTALKGADVLMRAVEHLSKPRPHVYLHGANLEHSPPEFQEQFRELLHNASDDVTLVGRYRPEELPRLMEAIDWVVIPSVWWENAPLVIQEAFAHGRPVIASDIGGMAEMVTDGVDGLHFRAGDPRHLAEVLTRAVSTPGLWEELRAGIRAVHAIDTHATRLVELYGEILDGRSSRSVRRGA
jgi:glycosyltransferase involved in cell wall biosynthesis